MCFFSPSYLKEKLLVLTAFTQCTLLYSFCVFCMSVLYSQYIQVNNVELPFYSILSLQLHTMYMDL